MQISPAVFRWEVPAEPPIPSMIQHMDLLGSFEKDGNPLAVTCPINPVEPDNLIRPHLPRFNKVRPLATGIRVLNCDNKRIFVAPPFDGALPG